ncbi:MAG TPA: helix-turn-helix domain-containing protein [Nitrososphaeraceae archaeon]|nr:helix-turn-helix domain-containing protein [Nitrososphaeraceae archaeon]
MEILSKTEKKALVIKLYKEGKTYKEIAEIVRISPRDIGRIINEYIGERITIYTKSNTSKDYDLFLKGKSPIQVAIKLDLKYEEVMKAHNEYWSLQGIRSFETMYKTYRDYWSDILLIIDKIRYHKISVQEFKQLCKYIDEIWP